MKNILSVIVMLSFSFTQTAIFSERDNGALGIWLSAGVYNIEYSDDIEIDDINFHIDMKSDFGLEIGMDYNDLLERWDAGFSYHIKKYDDGINVWGGIKILDIEQQYFEIGDALTLSVGAYTNNLINLTIEYAWFNNSNSTVIDIGKMIKITDNLGIGVSYSGNTDNIDEGWINLTLGSNFKLN